MKLDIENPDEFEYVHMCLQKYRQKNSEKGVLLSGKIRRRINQLINGNPEKNSPLANQACNGVSAIIRGTLYINRLRDAWMLPGNQAETLADTIIDAMERAKAARDASVKKGENGDVGHYL